MQKDCNILKIILVQGFCLSQLKFRLNTLEKRAAGRISRTGGWLRTNIFADSLWLATTIQHSREIPSAAQANIQALILPQPTKFTHKVFIFQRHKLRGGLWYSWGGGIG